MESSLRHALGGGPWVLQGPWDVSPGTWSTVLAQAPSWADPTAATSPLLMALVGAERWGEALELLEAVLPAARGTVRRWAVAGDGMVATREFQGILDMLAAAGHLSGRAPQGKWLAVAQSYVEQLSIPVLEASLNPTMCATWPGGDKGAPFVTALAAVEAIVNGLHGMGSAASTQLAACLLIFVPVVVRLPPLKLLSASWRLLRKAIPAPAQCPAMARTVAAIREVAAGALRDCLLERIEVMRRAAVNQFAGSPELSRNDRLMAFHRENFVRCCGGPPMAMLGPILDTLDPLLECTEKDLEEPTSAAEAAHETWMREWTRVTSAVLASADSHGAEDAVQRMWACSSGGGAAVLMLSAQLQAAAGAKDTGTAQFLLAAALARLEDQLQPDARLPSALPSPVQLLGQAASVDGSRVCRQLLQWGMGQRAAELDAALSLARSLPEQLIAPVTEATLCLMLKAAPGATTREPGAVQRRLAAVLKVVLARGEVAHVAAEPVVSQAVRGLLGSATTSSRDSPQCCSWRHLGLCLAAWSLPSTALGEQVGEAIKLLCSEVQQVLASPATWNPGIHHKISSLAALVHGAAAGGFAVPAAVPVLQRCAVHRDKLPGGGAEVMGALAEAALSPMPGADKLQKALMMFFARSGDAADDVKLVAAQFASRVAPSNAVGALVGSLVHCENWPVRAGVLESGAKVLKAGLSLDPAVIECLTRVLTQHQGPMDIPSLKRSASEGEASFLSTLPTDKRLRCT
mmetsp:Transcript_118097/g.270941  ORF Transcript_118097/g.270941 Transcript_118097/m.270941 type:complete len:746 (+) Transcript_118097:1-2238(+)